jgi:hypothetical protein
MSADVVMAFAELLDDYLNDLGCIQFFFSVEGKPVGKKEAAEFYASLTMDELEEYIKAEVL